ncbi:MAG: acetyl-CoA carboxylase, carboxyltransferase subunit beta [Pseudomonadota bacterium]
MNWLSNITPPGVKNFLNRQAEEADTLWMKCPSCSDMIFLRDLEKNLHVCPSCGHHMAIGVEDRLAALFDEGAYEKIAAPEPVSDPLKFRDEKKYADRLRDYRKKTGTNDALEVAAGTVDGHVVVAAVQNFAFMGGSMGMALGEAFLTAAQAACDRRAPLVVFTASGGARMQEGILSLMQMPRTTVGVQMMREARLPFVVVLTHPTTGGVTASFAMLGDVHFAEPGALIGFAGPRVIEQTIREKLPEGFQRSEFLHDKGMVDAVVPRAEIRTALSQLFSVLAPANAVNLAPVQPHAAPPAPAPGAAASPVPEAANDAAPDKAAE